MNEQRKIIMSNQENPQENHQVLMHPTMRAKLTVHAVTDDGTNVTVEFYAKYDSKNNPEDNSYSKYTPCATMKMTISSPTLKGTIKPGQQFYVDFTPIEKPVVHPPYGVVV